MGLLFWKRSIHGKNLGKYVKYTTVSQLKKIHGNRYACPVCKTGSMELGTRSCSCGVCGQTFIIEEES